MSSSDLSVGQSAFSITPSDTVNFASRARAIYVGTTGNVAAVFAGGTVALFTAVAAGSLLPIEVIRINATGTTASNIVGLV